MRNLEISYIVAKYLLNKALEPRLMQPLFDPEHYEGQEVLLPTGAKLVCKSETLRRKKTHSYMVYGYAHDARDIKDLGLTISS